MTINYTVTFRGRGHANLAETEHVEADSPEEAIQAFNKERGATIYADENYDVSAAGLTQRVRTTLPNARQEDGVLYVPIATKTAYR